MKIKIPVSTVQRIPQNPQQVKNKPNLLMIKEAQYQVLHKEKISH